MILEKIWRGRYVAESEKAIRDRRQGASGERKRRYAARARDRGGASVVAIAALHLKLLSRFSLSTARTKIASRSALSARRARDRARATNPGKCQVVTFMRSTTCHGIGKCVVINGVPIRSHPE